MRVPPVEAGGLRVNPSEAGGLQGCDTAVALVEPSAIGLEHLDSLSTGRVA